LESELALKREREETTSSSGNNNNSTSTTTSNSNSNSNTDLSKNEQKEEEEKDKKEESDSSDEEGGRRRKKKPDSKRQKNKETTEKRTKKSNDRGKNNNNDEGEENEFDGWTSDEIVQHWILNPPAVAEEFPDPSKGQTFQGATFGKGVWKYRDRGTNKWIEHDTYTNAVFEYNYRRGIRHFFMLLGGIKWEVSFDHRSQRQEADHNKSFVLHRD